MHVATRICHTDIVVLSQSPVMGAMAEAGGGDGGGVLPGIKPSTLLRGGGRAWRGRHGLETR